MTTTKLKLQESLNKEYDRILFSKEVLKPVFGSTFTLFSEEIPNIAILSESEKKILDKVVIYGRIDLEDGSEITCYEIILRPQVKIERSKIIIQKFVRRLLSAGTGALINFISPANNNIWRLSFVAREGLLTQDGVTERTTSAKRYTFLLGKGEKIKTAVERLYSLSGRDITLDDVKNAFSVDKMSKAFFEEYKEHYLNFVQFFTGKRMVKKSNKWEEKVIGDPNPQLNWIFKSDEKEARDFCKKLLGRIVFLYFVQKKGWLGASDTNYLDGYQDFIMKLFNESGANDGFYQSWLSVLFFETLNNEERSDDDFTMPDGSKLKIPFLNGGLFDKDKYDNHRITLPVILFHNTNFEDEPNKRGFLDFLNSYNFTIYEDSPEEHTVAVDPEMLSHIFENLLEDNKDKGAFYTPKEIVHYMCQESLIEYLTTHLSREYKVYKPLGSDQFELFGNEAKTGDLTFLEEYGDKKLNRNEVENIVKNKDFLELTEEQLIRIDELLDKVKICDPAIGSGAFPMGLLKEIFAVKELIAYILDKEWKPCEVKLNIIQNSIYGVDIEKGAVDIARLRFWLSLIVDEEKPKPLPNLDYKIVVGDSLVSKFDDHVVEINWKKDGKVGIAKELLGKINELLKQVTKEQRKYFNAPKADKQKISIKIKNLKIDLLLNQITLNKKQYEDSTEIKGGFMPTDKDRKHNCERNLKITEFDNLISKLQTLKKNPDMPFNHFDWKLDFPEILNPYLVMDEDQRGFDIVIGNPPWVSMTGKHGIEESKRNNLEILLAKYSGNTAMPNLYEYFIKLSFSILISKGIFAFIIPDRLGFNLSFTDLRKEILTNKKLLEIVYKWKFETVIADTMTIIYKNIKSDQYVFYIRTNPENKSIVVDTNEIVNNPQCEYRGYDNIFAKNLVTKIKHNSTPLRSYVKTTSGFGGKSELITDLRKTIKQVEVVKGRSIDKYKITKKYYFDFCEQNLTGRTRDQNKLAKKEKILLRKTGNHLIAAYDLTGIYPEQSLYFLYDFEINPLYILSLLNSKLFTWYFLNRLVTNEDSTPQLKNYDLDSFPIKISGIDKGLEIIVDYVIYLVVNNIKNYSTCLEQIIDAMVYELYFPELIKEYDCEINKHLGKLPTLKDKMNDDEKISIIQSVYDRLCAEDHPVRINLEKMKKDIKEIRIIEGLEE